MATTYPQNGVLTLASGRSSFREVLVTALASTRVLRDNELLYTTGYSKFDDGGGGAWVGITGGAVLYAAAWDVIHAGVDCWKRVYDEATGINICWFGCKDDGSVDCSALINNFLVYWKATRSINSQVTLFVPNCKDREHNVTTTNGNSTVTVASVVGLHVGQKIIGDGIPANARITAVGSGTITLSANATATGARVVHVSAWGFALNTAPIRNPDQLLLRLVGEGPARINSFNYAETNTTVQDRAGPIFVCAANIDGYSRRSDGESVIYPMLEISNVGFIGPGAPNTTATGVDTWLHNSHVSLDSVLCYGFRRGFWVRGGVSHHAYRRLKAQGNTYGLVLGDVAYPTYTIDGEFYDSDLQYNRTGLQIEWAENIQFIGGILQNNRTGTTVGVDGNRAINSIHLAFTYWENNGDAPLEYPEGYYTQDPGGCHFEFGNCPINGVWTYRATFRAGVPTTTTHTFATTTGSSVLTSVTPTTGLYVGQRVCSDPFNNGQGGARIAHGARIVSIVGSTVTLDKPSPEAGSGTNYMFGLGSQSIHLPDSANTSWHFCQSDGTLIFGVEGETRTRIEGHPGTTAGFTYHKLSGFAHVDAPQLGEGWGTSLGNSLTGTISWNVMDTHKKRYGIMAGDCVIGAPTNCPSGTKVTLSLQQPSAGGVLISSALAGASLLSNTGNTANKKCYIEIEVLGHSTAASCQITHFSGWG
jgi:hypothetical protein